ncbi:phage tail protein [Pontixanthobacter sp. CEM42]|uniref:phage tail protein n=1 Tax=Pontixanthobacter sp. CEM42 TaxID=2792077 RepID=UPI001ADF960E
MAVSAPTPAIAGNTPWIGEMVVPYTFCSRGWVEASGQLMSISSNSALYSLVGTNFGGDGRSTSAVPDLRGRSSASQHFVDKQHRRRPTVQFAQSISRYEKLHVDDWLLPNS